MPNLTIADLTSRTTSMAKKKWIGKAIKRPGALTRKAKAAGQSPIEFARAHKGDPGRTGQQARLAVTLRGMHGGKKKSPLHTHPRSP